MSTKEPDSADTQTASTWRLRMPGGTVFGPSPLSTLLAWAEQGRIEPGSKVSTDNLFWRPAEDIKALGLEWMIELDASTTVGPFHLGAVRAFLDDRSITEAFSLHNSRTGERTTVASKLSRIAGTTELEKATRDLHAAQSELREANTRLHSATAEMRTTAGKLQGKEAELQTAQEELRTARVEMNAAKALVATWKPEIESLRADCDRLRAALEAEKAAHEVHIRTALEAEKAAHDEHFRTALATEKAAHEVHIRTALEAEKAAHEVHIRTALEAEKAAHDAAIRSAEEQARNREADFTQEMAAMESRIASIAAQVDQKVTELTTTHRELEVFREQVADANTKVSDRDAAIISLQESLERARIEREQQDAVYRREQAESAAFRIAAARREAESKARIADLTQDLSLMGPERDAARRSEAAALARAAGLEKALNAAESESAYKLENAMNDRAAVERERMALDGQLQATKGELRVIKDKLQEIKRNRDELANALDPANDTAKSMRTRVGELTAAMAEIMAQRDAARQIEAERNSLAQRLREQESEHRNRSGEAERLQSQIADLNRLVNEYRLQIRTLADQCADLESAAAVRESTAQSTDARSVRHKPMNAATWNLADGKDLSPPPPDHHPLAGLEAKAAQELLHWRKTKDSGQKKPA